MLQTIVRPNKENFDIQVSLPAEYIGKDVHVLFYVEDEVRQTTISIVPNEGEAIRSEATTPWPIQNNVPASMDFKQKIEALKHAATDPLFLADIQEVEVDFKIIDQENV